MTSTSANTYVTKHAKRGTHPLAHDHTCWTKISKLILPHWWEFQFNWLMCLFVLFFQYSRWLVRQLALALKHDLALSLDNSKNKEKLDVVLMLEQEDVHGGAADKHWRAWLRAEIRMQRESLFLLCQQKRTTVHTHTHTNQSATTPQAPKLREFSHKKKGAPKCPGALISLSFFFSF